MVYIPDVFDDGFFDFLKRKVNQIILSNRKKKTSNHIFRKASILSKNDLNNTIVSELYPTFLPLINKITQTLGKFKCVTDKSYYNVLIYDKPNDFISWHKDPNHYIGNRLTVLLCLENTNENKTGLSSASLEYYLPGDKKLKSIKMKPNSILVFNGSNISHRATSISDGDKRVLVSYTYCNNCKKTIGGYIVKTIKEKILNY